MSFGLFDRLLVINNHFQIENYRVADFGVAITPRDILEMKFFQDQCFFWLIK